jgi:hypothetical protein
MDRLRISWRRHAPSLDVPSRELLLLEGQILVYANVSRPGHRESHHG